MANKIEYLTRTMRVSADEKPDSARYYPKTIDKVCNELATEGWTLHSQSVFWFEKQFNIATFTLIFQRST